MKLPNRAARALELLKEIKFTVQYFSGVDKLHKEDFKYLEDYIAEISESKKLSEIKLAAKIKKDIDDSN